MKKINKDQIYINVFFHVEDYYNPDLSAYALNRVIKIASKYDLRIDFYFSGLAAQLLLQQDATLPGRLMRVAGGIGYHGDLHVPGTSPQEKIKGMGWDKAVEEVLRIETHNSDKAAFEIADGRWPEGGLLGVERVFGNTPVVSIGGGVSGLPQVMYVHHKMGVKMLQTVNPVFAKHSTFFKWLNTIGWYVTPFPTDILAFLETGQVDVKKDRYSDIAHMIDKISCLLDVVADRDWQKGEDCLDLFSVPFHDFEVYSRRGWMGPFRTREDVEKYVSKFERMIAFVTAEPRVEPISLCEIPLMVAEADATMKRVHIRNAAATILESRDQRLPPFVKVEGTYFSISDLFLGLLDSLGTVALHGSLPESVVLKDIIGPTTITPPLKESLTMNEDQVFTTLVSERFRFRDRIPEKVIVSGTDRAINASEMLHLMAEAYLQLDGGKKVGILNVLPSEVLPGCAEDIEQACLSDKMQRAFGLRPLSRDLKDAYLLQLWTYKPMRIAFH